MSPPPRTHVTYASRHALAAAETPPSPSVTAEAAVSIEPVVHAKIALETSKPREKR
jgi:hypothetical protein